jgi:hypothetical protein
MYVEELICIQWGGGREFESSKAIIRWITTGEVQALVGE